MLHIQTALDQRWNNYICWAEEDEEQVQRFPMVHDGADELPPFLFFLLSFLLLDLLTDSQSQHFLIMFHVAKAANAAQSYSHSHYTTHVHTTVERCKLLGGGWFQLIPIQLICAEQIRLTADMAPTCPQGSAVHFWKRLQSSTTLN